MKKIIFSALLAVAGFVFTSCSSCQSKQGNEEKAEFVVENVISVDREAMYNTYGGDYIWFTTIISLEEYLDEECTGAIDSLYNVFEIIKDGQPEVIFSVHKKDISYLNIVQDFWVEDCRLNNEPIKVTFKEAFDALMATDCIKSHSKCCVLRKPLGPKTCNAQWVFGSMDSPIWVDAVTKEVRDYDPSF